MDHPLTPESLTTLNLKRYEALESWLQSKGFDQSIAALSVSSVSKKSGRVLKRVTKHMSGFFGSLRIVHWRKSDKFLYGSEYTTARPKDVLLLDLSNAPLDDLTARAVFQTDLYMRATGEHAEANAVTVACLSSLAIEGLQEQGLDWKKALDAARIFATGLDKSTIQPQIAHEFIIPLANDYLHCVNLPITREEHGENSVGSVIFIGAVIPGPSATSDEVNRANKIRSAMSVDKYPGESAFTALVEGNAKRL